MNRLSRLLLRITLPGPVGWLTWKVIGDVRYQDFRRWLYDKQKPKIVPVPACAHPIRFEGPVVGGKMTGIFCADCGKLADGFDWSQHAINERRKPTCEHSTLAVLPGRIICGDCKILLAVETKPYEGS